MNALVQQWKSEEASREAAIADKNRSFYIWCMATKSENPLRKQRAS